MQALDAYGSVDPDPDLNESQDVTCCSRPLASIPQTALAWSVMGTVVFTAIGDSPGELVANGGRSEIPYDDEYGFGFDTYMQYPDTSP
jgi:hypothetical protein